MQKWQPKMKEKINKDFWSEEFQSYADFIGTDKQAIHLIEDAICKSRYPRQTLGSRRIESNHESHQKESF